MLLAIETSCDETAIALFEGDSLQPSAERIASQIRLHEQYGGVVPELAAREHSVALPLLVQDLFSATGCSAKDIKAVAVTLGPGLQGCLLVGVSFAKAFAQALGIALYPIHHIEGHIAAVLLDPSTTVSFPALALVVSGGHTMLLEVSQWGDYSLRAETRDDAAGEAFDKIASVLGLPYPGGPSLSKVASSVEESRYSFPKGMQKDPLSFSFSGLKTAVARTAQALSVEELKAHTAELAFASEVAIVESLVEKTSYHAREISPKSLILTGGVAANSRLRKRMQELSTALGITLHVPEIRYCTDNAAMIGVVAQLQRARLSTVAWSAKDSLGPYAGFEIGARARWPFEELML